MPDVLVDFEGLRLAIEGEIASGTATKTAERKAAKSATQRVEQGVAHIGVAVVYPSAVADSDFSEMKKKLSRAPLRFAIITEAETINTGQPDLPYAEPAKSQMEVAFIDGRLDDLGESLRRAYEQLVKDEVLERAVLLLEAGIEGFRKAMSSQPAATDRCAEALGIQELPAVGGKRDDDAE